MFINKIPITNAIGGEMKGKSDKIARKKNTIFPVFLLKIIILNQKGTKILIFLIIILL